MKELADRNRHTKDIAINNNDIVLVRNLRKANKLSPIWENKLYKVVKIFPRNLKLQDMSNGKFYIRSKAHIKKYHGNTLEFRNKVSDIVDDDEEFLEIDFGVMNDIPVDSVEEGVEDLIGVNNEVRDVDTDGDNEDFRDEDIVEDEELGCTSSYGRKISRPERLIETMNGR